MSANLFGSILDKTIHKDIIMIITIMESKEQHRHASFTFRNKVKDFFERKTIKNNCKSTHMLHRMGGKVTK